VTVEELIAKLQSLPATMPVVIYALHYGDIEQCQVVRAEVEPSMYGAHSVVVLSADCED
jgi:hypothetical protein